MISSFLVQLPFLGVLLETTIANNPRKKTFISSPSHYILSFVCVKDYEALEILSQFQEKLACRNFIDAGRRHEIPESETKDSISHSTACSMSFMFPPQVQ